MILLVLSGVVVDIMFRVVCVRQSSGSFVVSDYGYQGGFRGHQFLVPYAVICSSLGSVRNMLRMLF